MTIDLDAAREVFRVEPMAGEVHILGNDLIDELERGRARIDELLARNTELVERNRAISIRTNVEQFHLVMGLPVLDRPQVPPDDRVRLRLRLITEEFFELLSATVQPWGAEPWLAVKAKNVVLNWIANGMVAVDLPEFVDALCDLDYVIEGTRLEFGIDGTPVLAEVQKANLGKLHDGAPVVREDGKVIKPEGWVPPDIESVLRTQGWTPPHGAEGALGGDQC